MWAAEGGGLVRRGSSWLGIVMIPEHVSVWWQVLSAPDPFYVLERTAAPVLLLLYPENVKI